MIHVRAMANTLTSMVNPNMTAILRVNLGYEVNEYGEQVATFEEHEIEIQAQSLESKEKDHLGLIDRQGEFISVYAYGSITAIQRWLSKGASQLTFTPYGEDAPVTWNVDKVLESYPTWTRLLLMRTT